MAPSGCAAEPSAPRQRESRRAEWLIITAAGGFASLLSACADEGLRAAEGHGGPAVGEASALALPGPSSAGPTAAELLPAGAVVLLPRAASWPTYPCTQCHEHQPGRSNPRERTLEQFHASRPALDHGALAGWCYRCHAEADLDELELVDGTRVAFDASHRLCGACHGEKLADWRRGIHGLRTGFFAGRRVARSCAHCHNPHRPRLGPMIAEPPPPPAERAGASP